MPKKEILIIVILIIVSLVGIVLYKNNKTKTESKNRKENSQEEMTMEDVEYDKETGLYYLKNKETGEIIGASKYKEDMKFYVEHPDYNPNPLQQRPTDLNSYIDIGTGTEINENF